MKSFLYLTLERRESSTVQQGLAIPRELFDLDGLVIVGREQGQRLASLLTGTYHHHLMMAAGNLQRPVIHPGDFD